MCHIIDNTNLYRNIIKIMILYLYLIEYLIFYASASILMCFKDLKLSQIGQVFEGYSYYTIYKDNDMFVV